MSSDRETEFGDEIALKTSVANEATLFAEFPFRIRLETLIAMTQEIDKRMAEVAGDLVLEVDGDRQRLALKWYPAYQGDIP